MPKPSRQLPPSPTDFELIPKLKEAKYDDESIKQFLSSRGHGQDVIDEHMGRAMAIQEIPDVMKYQRNQHMATATRFGIPILAGMATGGSVPLAMAAAGASEFGAQRIEGRPIDKSSLIETGAAAAFGGVGQFAANKATSLHRFISHKLSSINMSKLPVDKRRIYKVLTHSGGMPTRGQLSPEGSLSSWTENIARSSWFSEGRLKRVDAANITKLSDEVYDYVKTHADVGWNPQLIDADQNVAELLKDKYGKMIGGFLKGEINLADDVLRVAYEGYRNQIAGKGFMVDITPLRAFIENNANAPGVRKLLPKLRHLLGGKARTGGAETAAMSDVFESLAEEGIILSDDAIREIIEAIPNKIPVEDAGEILRAANSFRGPKSAKPDRWAANQIYSKTRGNFDKALPKEALQSYNEANKLYGRLADRLNKGVVNKLIKDMVESPSKIVKTILTGDDAFDKLKTLRTLFTTGAKGETGLTLKLYEDNVLKPLRHHIMFSGVDDATGLVSGQKLNDSLSRLGQRLTKEIFGDNAVHMKDLALTLDAIQKQGAGKAMWLKLAQGTVASSALISGFVADDPKIGAIALLSLAPSVLARTLTNPKLTKLLVEGLGAGKQSSKFKTLLGMLIALNVKDPVMQSMLSGEEREFYNNFDVQRNLLQSTTDQETGYDLTPRDHLNKLTTQQIQER